MTFQELYEEAAERGFNDLLQSEAQKTRLKRWVNQSYREIIDLAPWPFLDASKEGAAPLTVADLGHVLSVTAVSSDSVLRFLDSRSVTGMDPTRNDTGSPGYWYLEGETTIKVYPAEAGTILVRYRKVPAALSADADTPVLPAEYHDLIVDGTVVRAYKNRDNFEAAQFTRQEWERGIKGMTHALLKPNYDRERLIVRTGTAADYLG